MQLTITFHTNIKALQTGVYPQDLGLEIDHIINLNHGALIASNLFNHMSYETEDTE